MNREAFAKSLLWNVHTKHWAECVSKGVVVSHQTIVSDGWARIGRYAAGKQSAWVQGTKIKRKFPNLETKVIGTEDNEWKAELWVRKATTE